VAAHIEHIHGKLGFTSRTQIGVWAAHRQHRPLTGQIKRFCRFRAGRTALALAAPSPPEDTRHAPTLSSARRTRPRCSG
jgi:hypothetical protein